MRTHRKICVLFVALLLVCTRAMSQTPTGTPPFGSFAGGPDVINLANMNAHYTIPVVNKAGRGLPFFLNLTYDSSVWTAVTSGSTISWLPVSGWGWQTQTDAVTGYIPAPTTTQGSCRYFDGTRWITEYYTKTHYSGFWDEFHIHHGVAGLILISGAPDCAGGNDTATGKTTDGSGYTVEVPDGIVTSRGGRVQVVPVGNETGAATITDTNGNEITTSNGTTFYDTLSSTSPVLTISGTNPITYTYTPADGTPASVQIYYTNQTIQTTFCAGSPYVDYPPHYNVPLVSQVKLADGSSYYFSYEATRALTSGCTSQAPVSGAVTGRIQTVTLPTGGTITYTYIGGSQGIANVAGNAENAGFYRDVYDGTNTNRWTYWISGTGTTYVVDPQNNETDLTFDSASTIYEIWRYIYQGRASGGTLLREVETCWNNNDANNCINPVTLPITHKDVYGVVLGRTNRVYNTYDSTYGLLQEADEWDYQTVNFSGPAARKTLLTYATLANGIQDRPATITVEDGASPPNVKAITKYFYDQVGVTASSGTPQFNNANGNFGNLTEIDQLVSGSTYLKNHLTYYDTGMVKTTTDVNSAMTTYSYPNATSTCGNTFPTSLTLPLGLTFSASWNCNGGVLMSATDPNSKSATVVRNDPFSRITQITDPLSNVTNAGASPTSFEVNMTFNNSSSLTDAIITADGLGRTHVTSNRQGPNAPLVNNYEAIETDYDFGGRISRVTLPYLATSGYGTSASAPGRATTYDALNRPTQVTDSGGGTTNYYYNQNDVLLRIAAPTGENMWQYEYDGLGRLSSVCEITQVLPGSGPCGQNTTSYTINGTSVTMNGYKTSYTYDVSDNLIGVVQNGVTTFCALPGQSSNTQTRCYNFDGLSRMTSETNPETGTTIYTYDTESGTCNTTYSGDLVKQHDQAGNNVCYYYDSLHRLTDVGDNGPNATGQCERLRYDSQTVNGVAMVNSKGRLARAYTDNCAVSTPITDEGFSYDALGNLTDVWESTPHSGGYFHLAGNYYPNGAVANLNYTSGVVPTKLPGLNQLWYAVEGEGRTYGMYDNTAQVSPFPSTTYNTASQPLTVTLENSDSDSFQYDANTSRPTQFKAAIGSQSMFGNLGWNANGSLASLDITDPFNTNDSQNCTYGADDLGRISNVTCGTKWEQTFSYDAFGNVNKTGTNGGTSFLPGPYPNTNRIPGYSYDNDGNLTKDNFNNQLIYDVFGHLITVNSGPKLLYDALGRNVEYPYGSSMFTWVYGLDGQKLAAYSGQSLINAIIPMTGGGKAIYNSAGLEWYRHPDWLGSVRIASTPSHCIFNDSGYSPFGEPYGATSGCGGAVDPTFTGKSANVISSLYDFPARELSPSQGRWISPDPAGRGAVDRTDPQTWNRYAYVRNSPMNNIDPDGTDLVILCGPDFCAGSGGAGGIACGGVPGFGIDSGGGPFCLLGDFIVFLPSGDDGGDGGGAGDGGLSGSIPNSPAVSSFSGNTSPSFLQCASDYADLGSLFTILKNHGLLTDKNTVAKAFLTNTGTNLTNVASHLPHPPPFKVITSLGVKGLLASNPFATTKLTIAVTPGGTPYATGLSNEVAPTVAESLGGVAGKTGGLVLKGGATIVSRGFGLLLIYDAGVYLGAASICGFGL